jgi:hypothetical protein
MHICVCGPYEIMHDDLNLLSCTILFFSGFYNYDHQTKGTLYISQHYTPKSIRKNGGRGVPLRAASISLMSFGATDLDGNLSKP